MFIFINSVKFIIFIFHLILPQAKMCAPQLYPKFMGPSSNYLDDKLLHFDAIRISLRIISTHNCGHSD